MKTKNSPEENLENLTPLMIAIKNYDLNNLKELLAEGPNLEEKNVHGYTAFMIAARTSENLNVVMMLTEKKADLEVQDKYGNTALINAVTAGHPKKYSEKNKKVNFTLSETSKISKKILQKKLSLKSNPSSRISKAKAIRAKKQHIITHRALFN